MVSIWWVMLGFMGGGCAGILIVALMRMSGGLPEPSPHIPDLTGTPY